MFLPTIIRIIVNVDSLTREITLDLCFLVHSRVLYPMKLLILLESEEIDHFKDGVRFAGFLLVERPFFRRSGRAFD